jgi:glutamine synthetase
MFSSYRELVERVKSEQIETLDFKVTELSGRWKHLSVPASRMTEKLFRNGFGFDGSNYGYARVESSDMVFIPEWSTGFRDPFWETPTLSFLGTVHEIRPEGFVPYPGDSRVVLQKALDRMESEGVADRFVIGPEFEFHILDSVSYRNDMQASGFVLDAAEAEWHTHDEAGHLGARVPRKGGYHADAPQDLNRDLRAAMSAALERLGIAVKYHHHEVGGPGQHEIEVVPDDAARLGDGTMLVKYVVKNLARAWGKLATFMPKPFFGEAGNGMHVHMQLFKAGEPVFAGLGNAYAGLSETALHFMGGILTHTAALSGLASPGTNSYRRLVRGYEAPVAVAFAMGNRSAVIRIPGYAKAPEDRRFEFRSSDASCNPYLLYAALLAAGMDGIAKGIDPIAAGFGPLEKNIYEVADRSLELLPSSLEEALDALERDHDFLLAGGVFPESLIENWVSMKRLEARRVFEVPTPMEMALYLDC